MRKLPRQVAVITDATGVGNLGNGVVGLLQRHPGRAGICARMILNHAEIIHKNG